ncbi:MAG: GtrA family protein [Methylobacter sp.]
MSLNWAVTWGNSAKLLLLSYLWSLWRHSTFLRYLFIGGINTLFSYSVYALGLYFGLNYQLANLLALILGIISGFILQGRIVFKNADKRLFLQFLFFWLILYSFNILFIGVIINFGFNAYEAGAIALMPMVLISFVIQKAIIFRLRRKLG